MKVVIVGDGKVGGTIARQLSGEGHDIIVIDNNTSVLNNASNTITTFMLYPPYPLRKFSDILQSIKLSYHFIPKNTRLFQAAWQ